MTQEAGSPLTPPVDLEERDPMSEYQYYEFVAIDRPLNQQQMAELRALSTRATITSTRFQNEYHWGNFRGNPSVLMEKYFDAFVYVANWGTQQFMLRLPRRLLELETAERYCGCDAASARAKGDFVILEFLSDEEGADEFEGGEGWLASLVPLRAEIASGDLRGLYLGWLLCAQSGQVDDEDIEPPVPPGLSGLSAAQEALVDFLRIDEDLIAVAAERSAPMRETRPPREALEQWIRELPQPEKDGLLLRLVEMDDPHLGVELLRRFQRSRATEGELAASESEGGRTVGELLQAAEQYAEKRQREEAQRRAREQARREREEAEARAKYLDGLVGREEELWQRVEALVPTKKPKDYDQAVRLLKDLRDLASRASRSDEFGARLSALRQRHSGKPTFIERLDKAGLGAGVTLV